MALFYHLVTPPTMQDYMAVVQSDYDRVRETLGHLCPVSPYRTQALQYLEASLMRALWSFRLQKEG